MDAETHKDKTGAAKLNEPEDTHPLLQSEWEKLKTRLITIEPLAFLYIASWTLTAVVKLQYIEERLAQDRNYTLAKDNDANGTCASMDTSDPDYKIQEEIAADLATWATVLSVVVSLPVLFVAPFYGVLSDRVGRKITFAIPIAAQMLYCIVFLLIMYIRLPVFVFVFGAFIHGCGGHFLLFSAGCYAYISDISTKKSRLLRMAIVQVVMTVAALIVQVPTGYIIEAYGFIPIVWSAFALLIAAILYLIIPRVLPETVKHIDTDLKISTLLQNFQNLFAVNIQKRRYRLIIVLTIYAIVQMIQLSGSAVGLLTIYGLGPPFCWAATTVGYFNILYLVFSAIGTLTGTKLFSLCLDDQYIVQIAFLFGVLSNLYLAWAPTTVLFFLGTILTGLRSMDAPVLNSVLSNLVTPEEYGAVFAVQSSVVSAGNILSPLILNTIYSATVSTQPSLVFYVIAGIFVTLIILTWFWMFYTKRAVRLPAGEEAAQDTTEISEAT